MVAKPPLILHISCHGRSLELNSPMKKHKMGNTSVWEQIEESNFLLFETEIGDGALISGQELREFIGDPNERLHSLDVVLIAACTSDFIGKVMLKCGAKHVICIQNEKYVMDQAAIKFTKTFYDFVFSGLSICSAFKKAVKSVSLNVNAGEAKIF